MDKNHTKNAWTKSVCIATQIQESDAPEILRGSNLDVILLTSAFFSVGLHRWVINPSALYCTVDGFYPFSPLGIEIGVDDILNDNAQEGQALMMLLTALACSNVKTQIVLPPDALNKKRIRNSKPPFRSHHILVIGEKPANKTTGDGSHASPRQHLRRGHIRKLENKNVWVNACVVGSATNGVATKDYSIKKRMYVP